MRITEDELAAADTQKIVSIPNDDSGTVHLYKHESNEYPYITHVELPRTENDFIWKCDTEQKARLVVGLFNAIDLSLIETDDLGSGYTSVHLAISLAGNPYIAAYIKLFEDQSEVTSTRRYIADIMGVSEQTVSNYLHRVRWDGCIGCGSKNIERLVVEQADGDEVEVVYCKDCGMNFVYPEDFRMATHSASTPGCVDDLERSVSVDGTVELWCCKSCGFYTANPDRHSVVE